MDVFVVQPPLLPSADVDDRRPGTSTLDAGRRVAHQAARRLQHGDELVHRHVRDEADVARWPRCDARESGEGFRHLARPASELGQNQIVGIASAPIACMVVSEMAPVVRLGRDRMLNHHQERLRDVDRVADAVAVHLRVGEHRRRLRRNLDVKRAGVEDVSRILAHRRDPPSGVVVGHEMMWASLVIACRTLSSMLVTSPPSMRNRLVQIRGRHGDRQLLEPVAADDHDVGVEGVKTVGELESGEARRLAIATWFPPR
jgi:hypothetical protein